MTLREAKDEMYRMQNIVRKLEEEELDAHREAARKFVGKCYKSSDGEFFKIIGIPRTYLHMSGCDYNRYQFPAVFLQYPDMPNERCFNNELDAFVPCYCDTIYLNIDDGHPRGCIEIAAEEFNEAFDEHIAYFKEQIKV